MTDKTMKLLHYLSNELGEKPGRIDYEKAAEKIGMTYQGVRYAVGTLNREGYVKIDDWGITVLQTNIPGIEIKAI